MKKNPKFWIALSLIAVFAAGMACGFLIDKHLDRRERSRRDRRRGSPHFPTLEIMAEELKLTSNQQTRIKELFKKNEETFKTLGRHMGERLSAMRKQLLSDIKNVLDKEQNQRFDAMVEDYMNRMKQEMESRKKRPPPSRNPQGEHK